MLLADLAPEPGLSHRVGAALATALPTISRLGTYSRGWFRDDVAGLTLSALLVPVGMGYAEAAGLPAIAGLYATIGALIAYFLVGPSRFSSSGRTRRCCPWLRRPSCPLPAAIPRARHRPRGCPRDHVRAPVPGCRDRPPGLRHRPPVAADPGWLHERNRAHDRGRPAAEAAGVLGGRQRRRRRRHRARPGDRQRGGRPGCPPHRGEQPGVDPRAAEDLAPDPGRPRGRRCSGRGRLRPRPLLRAEGGRRGTARSAGHRPPARLVVRPGDPLPDGARDRPDLVRRHERHLAHVRRPPRRARGRRPRAGGPRGRERGGRPLRWVLVQRERDAHPGRGVGRFTDAGHRACRRGGHRRAAGGRARPAGTGPDRGPRRSRDSPPFSAFSTSGACAACGACAGRSSASPSWHSWRWSSSAPCRGSRRRSGCRSSTSSVTPGAPTMPSSVGWPTTRATTTSGGIRTRGSCRA